jgi:hypothetical protein
MALLFTQSGMAQPVFTGADLGAPTFAGSVTPGTPTTTIKAGGSDIWNASDNGYFYYTPSEAMVWEATVRVQNLVCPGIADGAQWAKCELMVRMDQGTGAPEGSDAFIASMTTQPSSFTTTFGATGVNWVVDQFRTAASGNADWISNQQWGDVSHLYTAGNPAPNYPNRWLRLKRLFSVFTVQDSEDGVTWNTSAVLDTSDPNAQPAGVDNATRFNTPFSGNLFIGVAVTSHDDAVDDSNCAVATISDLTFEETIFVDTEPPTAPTNLRTTLVGARRVELRWDPSTDLPVRVPPNPVFYNVYRDGVAIKSALSTTNAVDAPGPDQDADKQLVPGSSHTYTVEAIDVNLNKSAVATLAVTLLAEVPVPGYFKGQIYTNITTTANTTGIPDLLADPNFPGSPGKVGWWVSGLSFNQPSGAFGDNYGFRFTGTLTPPKTGNYRFFVRSDDASQFFLNTTGPTPLPDPSSTYPIAQEDDCCDPFFEPGQDENVDTGGVGTGTFPTSAAIPLTAGTKYGFVWLVKEGTGGDWGQVAWRMEGDTTAAANLPPIGGLYVEPTTGGAVSDPGGASAAITQEPQDMTGGANAHLNLWVATATTSPWGYGAVYQWYKDGVAIMNAARTNLYFDVLAPADAGLYKVFVTVPGASTTSREATLTVTNDLTLPTLVDGSAHGSADFLSVTFRASEPVSAASGTYQISGGVNVTSAVNVDLYTIRLTTSLQASGTEYTITVNNLRDNAGNAIAPNSTLAFKSFIEAPLGSANFQRWQYGAAPALATFVDEKIGLAGVAPTAPSDPAFSGLVQGFETPSWENGSFYGGRIAGYFIPPTSGDYVFFCTSDDNSWLMLSTDENPANKKKIAYENSWSNQRQWLISNGGGDVTAKRSDQWTATEWASGAPAVITLTANQRYYMEGVWQEGEGGDGFGATYKLASEADSVVANGTAPRIAGNLLQALFPVDPWVGAPVIAQGPSPVAYAKGETITRSVVVGDGARPLTYQWYKNNTIIDPAVNPSAATATLTIPNAGINDMADYKCTVSNPAGSVTSTEDNGRAWMKGMTMLIEAEDFNYNGGQIMAAANTLPYLGDAYKGLTNQAVADVDFFANGNDAGGSALAYDRFAQTNTAPNFIETKGGTPASNNDGGSVTATARFRGDFTVDANYALGWTVNGQWQNYTRTIPQGTYYVIGGFANDGRGVNAIRVDLSTVANATIADGSTGTGPIVAGDLQGVTKVGTFLSDGTGAWSSDDLIPLKTDAGEWAIVTAPGGSMTFRMTARSGPDLDYFALYEAGVVPRPEITGITVGAGGAITVTWTGGGTLEAAPAVTGPWQAVTGATSPYTFTPTEAILFGRIRQ